MGEIAAVCTSEQTAPTCARNTWDHPDGVPFKRPMDDEVKVAIKGGGAETRTKSIEAGATAAVEAA